MSDENGGPQYFASNISKSVKPSYKRVGKYFGGNVASILSTQNTNTIDIKQQLFTNALRILTKKGVSVAKIRQFKHDMVTVIQNENTNPVGSIECVLCPLLNGKRELHTVQSKLDGDPPKVYWVLSNFGKHIAKHFKKPKANAPEGSNSNLLMDPDISNEFNESYTEAHRYTEEMIEVSDDKDIVIETVDETNDSTIFLQIEPMNQSFSADDVQSRIYTQLSEQINNMIEVSLKHNVTEIDSTFKIEDNEFTLQFAQIDADGCCLFAALAHQLFRSKIGSRLHENATSKLRKDVVEYIKSHRTDFEYELKGIVYELNEGIKIENLLKRVQNI